MNKRSGTVCFIIEGNKVLLALIEYSSSERKWNGIGGFVNENESPEDAVVREISEETYIDINKDDLIKVKELDLEIRLFIYVIKKWGGEIKTKEPSLKELRWFEFDKIPHNQMFENNIEWLPGILLV
jgi:ADP-ribose pyrophosphatase YjhB (NUDIX family)